MNVFYTDTDPAVAANQLNRVHRNKMLVEYCQLLSTAHHVLDGEQALRGIYRKTHEFHPSAAWTRSSVKAYKWVLASAKALCVAYTDDMGKIHKSERVVSLLEQLPCNIKESEWRDPPIAAPDKFKAVAVFEGVIVAYQEYLKDKYNEWLSRDKPVKVEFVNVPYWYS